MNPSFYLKHKLVGNYIQTVKKDIFHVVMMFSMTSNCPTWDTPLKTFTEFIGKNQETSPHL